MEEALITTDEDIVLDVCGGGRVDVGPGDGDELEFVVLNKRPKQGMGTKLRKEKVQSD